MEDYYSILGIERGASDAEIKKAYRKKAKEFHPDTNPGDKEAESKFKEINEANEVLSDSRKRSLYDQHGNNWDRVSDSGGFSGFGGHGFTRDMFESIIRQQAEERNRVMMKGEPMEISVSLSLEDCYNGCVKEVEILVNKQCSGCSGNGSKNGTSIKKCESCKGSGQNVVYSNQGPYSTQYVSTCESCMGKGVEIEEVCEACNGIGFDRVKESVRVKFPRGVRGGQYISKSRVGNFSRYPQGERGDVAFFVNEEAHKLFKRDPQNPNRLIYTHKVGFEDLVLGSSLEITKIMGGSVKMEIKPGAKANSKYRLSGLGMPVLNLPHSSTPSNSPGSAFGDCIVELEIEIPTDLNEEELELIKKFKKLRGKSFGETK